MAYVTLKINKEHRLLAGHPWIYAGEIEKIKGDFIDGDIVKVKDHKGRFIGQGLINRKSQITIRLISRTAEEIDKNFFRKKIESALEHRKNTGKDTNASRIFFSEGDFLPGLIIDDYNGHIVIQMLSLGIDNRKDIFIDIIKDLLRPKTIYERDDVSVRTLEGLPQEKGFVYGGFQEEIICDIKGIKFIVDIENGHKTGFYLDQIENYAVLMDLVKDKTVLDCFSYTGGFGVASAIYGAKRVIGIDISENAVKIAKKNAEMNNVSDICAWETGNVFDFLNERCKSKDAYDMVILDPPSFTKGKDKIQAALRGYKEINLRALQLLQRGGYLVTCCCSHHISRNLFMEVIIDAAMDAGKLLRLVEYRTQSKDHPIILGIPETEYLKCFILQVV